MFDRCVPYAGNRSKIQPEARGCVILSCRRLTSGRGKLDRNMDLQVIDMRGCVTLPCLRWLAEEDVSYLCTWYLGLIIDTKSFFLTCKYLIDTFCPNN